MLHVRRRLICIAQRARGEDLSRPVFSAAYYEEEAAHRRYFYFVDERGRLYLDEHWPKGIATCLRAPKFLDFFFSPRNLRVESVGGLTGSRSLFPFISHCGKERNFVRAAATPVVFHSLYRKALGVADAAGSTDAASSADATSAEAGSMLGYAHSLEQRFDPRSLRVCQQSGRLFHKLGVSPGGMALLRTDLAEELGRSLEGRAGGGFSLRWEDETVHLPWLEEEDDHLIGACR